MEDDVADTELLKRLAGPHTDVTYSTFCASSHPDKRKYNVSYLFIFLFWSVTLIA